MTPPYKASLGARITPPAAKAADRPPQAHDLFATRIWQSRLHHLSPHVPGWVAVVLALRAAAPTPAGRTNRGGWNSADHAVLDHDAFAELREAVLTLCRLALQETGLAEPRFGLQSWINMHDRGGFNFLHLHDGCLLSGAFYLQVPDGSGDLVLRDPRPGVLQGFAKGSGANACKEVRLRPEAGLVVLFPSWLEHYVDVHDSDTPRISIPFNAVRP